MNLENIPLEIGQTVFFPKDTAAGKKCKPGKVIDLNETVGGVKIEFVPSKDKIKRDWFNVKLLRRSEPPKEVAS